MQIIGRDGYIPDVDYLKKIDLMRYDYIFKIKYRKELLITISYIKKMNNWITHIDYSQYFKKLNNSRFMYDGEVTNLKRTLLIDNMLK